MRPACSSVFRSRKLFLIKEQVARDLTPTAVAKLLFRNVLAGLVFTGLTLLPSNSSAQQQSATELKDLKKEIESLKTGQTEIQKELQEIKKLLLARPAGRAAEPPREIVVNTAGAPFKGEKNAKLTLIEFSDYQCPFCSRYVQETLPQIEKDYVKTGKVKYVFRDFPLESIHQNALLASQAANCAGDQGKYWEMHDQLFGNQNALNSTDMSLHAKTIGIDAAKFQQCLDSKKYESEVRQRTTEAINIGVRGTPTFFLGLTTPDDPKLKVLTSLSGAQPYLNFKEAIDKLLSSPPSQP